MARAGIKVEFVVTTDKFTRKLNLIARSMKQFGREIEKAGKRMQRMQIAMDRRPALIHNGRKP